MISPQLAKCPPADVLLIHISLPPTPPCPLKVHSSTSVCFALHKYPLREGKEGEGCMQTSLQKCTLHKICSAQCAVSKARAHSGEGGGGGGRTQTDDKRHLQQQPSDNLLATLIWKPDREQLFSFCQPFYFGLYIFKETFNCKPDKSNFLVFYRPFSSLAVQKRRQGSKDHQKR